MGFYLKVASQKQLPEGSTLREDRGDGGGCSGGCILAVVGSVELVRKGCWVYGGYVPPGPADVSTGP